MTLENARSITGLEIFLVPCHEGFMATARHPEYEAEVCWGDGKTASEALQHLVDANWTRIVTTVAKQQNWRCADCGKIKPLQGHHRKMRSRGRKDVVENVRALCSECHRQEHG